MQANSFLETDIEEIPALQPHDWSDLRPFFRYYLQKDFCTPLKISIDNKVVAVGVSIIHHDSAWLAHIVVHPDYRNRGLGNDITMALLETIDREKCRTISLVATPLGEPVYRKIGFEEEGGYLFFRGKKLQSEFNPKIIPFNDTHSKQVFEIDRNITGEDREFRLREYLDDASVFVEGVKVTGFYLPSFGDGLILASNDTTGIELMKFRLKEKDFAILPKENIAGVNFLEENDFEIFRTATRMRIGDDRFYKPARIYNRVSGQIG